LLLAVVELVELLVVVVVLVGTEHPLEHLVEEALPKQHLIYPSTLLIQLLLVLVELVVLLMEQMVLIRYWLQ
jgi:hypothetical protein